MSSDALNQGLTLMLVGMGVVFLSLAFMAILLTVLGRLLAEGPAVPPASAAPQAPAPPSPTDQTIDPELLAVLSAAAYAAVSKPIRVTRVIMVGHAGTAWVTGGRTTAMGLHRPRK